jgi:lactoylglutathione lyase
MAVKSALKISTLSYAIVYVKDTKKALEFYTNVLGFKVKVNAPDWVEFETGATTVALHGDTELKEQGRNTTVLVFPVENIDEAHEALKNSGAKVIKAPHQVCETPDGYGYSCDFEDVEGNLLSLYAEKKK